MSVSPSLFWTLLETSLFNYSTLFGRKQLAAFAREEIHTEFLDNSHDNYIGGKYLPLDSLD
jgi:hypothetical protein